MAPTIAEWMSVSVAAATRAAKVEAFSSWSACSTSETSNARAASADGRWPVSMYRKFAACPSAGSGSIGPPPAAIRPQVATSDADLAGQPHGLAVVGLRRLVAGVGVVVPEHGGERPQRVHAVDAAAASHRPEDGLGRAPGGRELRLQVARARRGSAAGRATAGSRPPRTTRPVRHRRGRGCRSPDTPARRARRRGSRSPSRRRRRLPGRPWVSRQVVISVTEEQLRARGGAVACYLPPALCGALTSRSSPPSCWKIDSSPMYRKPNWNSIRNGSVP